MLFAKWMARGAFAVAVLAAALVGGWACTDDEGNALTLEEYFDELQALDESFNSEADAAFEDVSEDPEPSEIQAALEDLTGIIRDFVESVDELSPPDEAEEAHDAAVEAGNATVDAYDALADAAGEAESVDDLFTSEAAQDAEEALDQFATACLDLQQIADDNNVDASLNCGDDEEA